MSAPFCSFTKGRQKEYNLNNRHAVVAIILVAWEICAIRKYRKAKKEDEDTEQ